MSTYFNTFSFFANNCFRSPLRHQWPPRMDMPACNWKSRRRFPCTQVSRAPTVYTAASQQADGNTCWAGPARARKSGTQGHADGRNRSYVIINLLSEAPKTVNPSYSVFVAHNRPEMCPLGAFAFYHHYIMMSRISQQCSTLTGLRTKAGDK